MSVGPLTKMEFNRAARLYCLRWSPRSLGVVRALLVYDPGGPVPRLSKVAESFGMTPQQANVLRGRFLERMKGDGAAKKLPAEQYMQSVDPALTDAALLAFTDDIKTLVKRGYSDEQIAEFLHANDVKISSADLITFLGALNEDQGSGSR